MNENRHIKRLQIVVATSSAILIILLISAWIVSGLGLEWKQLQKEFSIFLIENGDSLNHDENSKAEKGIIEYDIEGLNRVDRCVTCHLGMDNQKMASAPKVFKSHPGDYLVHHPKEDYGCTVCHGGQGRALNSHEAHATEVISHWNHPLLSQPYIQSSCGKCHLSIFSENVSFSGIEVYSSGQEIFNSEGCLGCHKARGVGGILGPDLTEQGEKTIKEYSFQNITSDQTIVNWLKEHFKDPEMVSPGSKMLRIDLPEEDLVALSTFVLGLTKPDIDFEYFSMESLMEFKGQRENLNSELLYSMACSGCHGKNGKGKSYVKFNTGVPANLNPDFLRVASKDFIEFTLHKGRSQRQMSSWLPLVSGLRLTEIDKLVTQLYMRRNTLDTHFEKKLLRESSATNGEAIFQETCSTCHGEKGRGGVALPLNNADFLENAGDDFLFNTLMLGRENAGMPSWQNLSSQDIYNLIRYLRSWIEFNPQIRSIKFQEIDSEKGRVKYHFLCSRCHGESGEGQTGPSIINKSFSQIASDEYLYSTIANGRSHSAMFGWSKDVYNDERLEKDDIGNIIGYLRKMSESRADYIYAGSNPGDASSGASLFYKHCAKCHGSDGEGTEAPALNNQELLSAASNGYFMATITIGRKGTAMPSWGETSLEHPMLSGEERQDIVAWIRNWQRIHIKF